MPLVLWFAYEFTCFTGALLVHVYRYWQTECRRPVACCFNGALLVHVYRYWQTECRRPVACGLFYFLSLSFIFLFFSVLFFFFRPVACGLFCRYFSDVIEGLTSFSLFCFSPFLSLSLFFFRLFCRYCSDLPTIKRLTCCSLFCFFSPLFYFLSFCFLQALLPLLLWFACDRETHLFSSLLFLFFSFSSGLWRAGSSAVTALICLRKSSSHLTPGFTSQFTCFTGTEVQILTRDWRLATALLTAKTIDWDRTDFCVLSLLALLAQKYEYWHQVLRASAFFKA